MLNAKTVFILAPHPDDAEIGCGATMGRLIENGAKVYVLVFGKDNVRMKELERSMKFLKVTRVFSFEVPIRDFSRFRQPILDKMVMLKGKLAPDLVIQPSLDDIHQDHQVIAREGLRAFKDTSLLGYEAAWNNVHFNAQMFIKIEGRHIGRKVQALRFYESQRAKPYMDPEYVISLARVRGVQAGFEFAEMFNVVRQIVA